jgi:Protein of unknown function (DUF1647)
MLVARHQQQQHKQGSSSSLPLMRRKRLLRRHDHHGRSKKNDYYYYYCRGRISAMIVATLVAVAVGWATTLLSRFFFSTSPPTMPTFSSSSSSSSSTTTTTTTTTTNQTMIQVQKNSSRSEAMMMMTPSCRYDGHCPTGMTCAAAAAVAVADDENAHDFMLPGLCQPILPVTNQVNGRTQHFNDTTTTATTTVLEACFDACEAELRMDEHFYQAAWPKVVSRHIAAATLGRPASGCILYYRRLPDRPDAWKTLHARDVLLRPFYVAQSVQTWEGKTRFRHLKRVDPVIVDQQQQQHSENHHPSRNNNDSNMDEEIWMAYCTAPCRTQDDCQPPLSLSSSPSSRIPTLGFPFVCNDGACQRNETWWSRKTKAQQQLLQEKQQGDSEMVIVTAADAHFYRPVLSLIASAQYWAPQCQVVVYNLGGLDRQQKQSILQQPNVLSLEWQHSNGIPRHYPHHVHQDLQNYAWKPIIIQQALAKYQMILWLDAGSTITGPIDKLQDIVQRTGLFLVKGQDVDMKEKSHPLTYEWFNFSKTTMQTGPHFSGNTQAYLSPSRYVDTIVHPNAACALDVNCIAPPVGPTGNGSTTNIGNHRFDQTSLSICAYHPRVRAPHYTEYLAATRSQVAPGLFDKSKPNFRFVWTSRSAYDFAAAFQCLQQNKNKYINNTASSIVVAGCYDG